MAFKPVARVHRLPFSGITVSIALAVMPALGQGLAQRPQGEAPKPGEQSATPDGAVPATGEAPKTGEATAALTPDQPAEETDSQRPVRVGVLVGLSVPRPLSIEVFAKAFELFGVGLGYSVLPTAVSDWLLSLYGIHNVSVDSSAIEIDLRLFPLRGSFFLGSSFGRQTLTASATAYGVTAKGEMTTLYATPRLGWLWIIKPGISFGTDLGVQLPLSYSYTVTPPQANIKDVTDAANLVGSTPLPALNLRFGFMF
jgi:hypothetical protein